MEMKLSGAIRDPKERLDDSLVPAILYGREVENVSLKIKRTDLDRLVKEAGESNLIDLSYGDANVKVLIKESQRHPVSNLLQHVDFFQVNMKEKINTEIPLEFVGESRAIRELSGSLIRNVNALEIECLPKDLVDHIDVDISVLDNFEDEIKVSDIKIPATWDLLSDPDVIVASVIPPRVEEEVEVAIETEAGEGEEKKEENKDEKDKA
ncbi:MAG: 50S ribosomal protein L25 [Candidatus Parcubacteria bacterium]|jgi:large subunit ribosomal protein L25|nr:MAG: 50S ribosomal protein L25/general stress protein Ctc [Candidatus Parcubacteria bacterium]